MDDLRILRDEWGQPDPPSADAYTTALAALLERQQVPADPAQRRGTVRLPGHGPAPRGRGDRWHGRRGVRRTAVAGACLAAAAVTVLAAQFAARPGATGPGASAGITVRELAYRTAAVAAAGPDVRPGQWVYWQEKQVGGSQGGIFQVWTTADARQAAYIYRGKVRFLRPGGCGSYGAASGCYFDGQPVPMPARGGPKHGVSTLTTVTGPMAVPYPGLSSLPRNPLALDRYLGRLHLPGWGPAPFREFQIISDLLTSYVMPPALTAELYQSLSDIPGVTVDQHAVDVAGRTGVGFQIAVPKQTGGGAGELVINPHTYRLMGQELLTTHAGSGAWQVLSGSAVLRRVLVSGPGVQP